ncbi:MAG TPA: DNA translocase FtsK 4TM domain-containing protein [Methylomirabilota bacterium]|nr:DNA translocase FtsK 4TM domain-containing protein [Methylomirabilota bacterium]
MPAASDDSKFGERPGGSERNGKRTGERMRGARKKKEAHRWVREARAIGGSVIAAFALVALATYRASAVDGYGPSGPIGHWLAWALFQAFGYAAFLFPLLLGLLAASTFVRPLAPRGWAPVVGLAIVLVSTTALLTQSSPALPGDEILAGGVIGLGLSDGLRGTLGNVGAWLVPLAGIPVGVLFVTQVSYGAWSRIMASRLRKRRARGAAGKARVPTLSAVDLVTGAGVSRDREPAPSDDKPFTLPAIVEPAKVRSSEKGLAWQETFAFGKNGAPAFQPPPVGLLHAPSVTDIARTREELQDNAETLRKKLLDFDVEGRIVQVSPGPIITSYEFEPAAGVKVSQVVNLSDDLALSMKTASVRIVGPIPGRGTVAVEVPNEKTATVYLREIFISTEFAESKGKLPLALGKDTTGAAVVADLTAMPHLLVAGATGAGKSVGLNGMICSILYKATPADVRFLLIDPKRLELSVYEGIPHLLAPVVTDAKEAAARLRWIVGKMDERYKTLQTKQVRNIEGYNKAVPEEERLPYWVVVVDELADLMMVSAGEVQNSLVRLAQIARAVGIHLIVATQRPSVDVVTGLIKANFPTRIAFQVASKVDSRTILDGNGAEQLLGRGDMIYVPPGASRQMRVHGCWISDDEVKGVCEFLRKQGTAVYEEVALPSADGPGGDGGDEADRDQIYWDCVRLVIGQRAASISFLQRRMGLGYPKAARFIDMMEQDRIIGPGQGAKPREILVGPEYLEKSGRA